MSQNLAMESFTVTLVELADGESIEVAVAEVLVDEFRVSLLSPEQLKTLKRTLGTKAFRGLTDVTYTRCLTNETRYGAFPAVRLGGWFVVFPNGEAVGVQLMTTTRTKPAVDGESGRLPTTMPACHAAKKRPSEVIAGDVRIARKARLGCSS